MTLSQESCNKERRCRYAGKNLPQGTVPCNVDVCPYEGKMEGASVKRLSGIEGGCCYTDGMVPARLITLVNRLAASGDTQQLNKI